MNDVPTPNIDHSSEFDPNDYGLSRPQFERLVEVRRHLHAHPELSNQEFVTSEYIRERLDELDVDSVETVDDTGVVAVVEGTRSGPTLAWRADIDALPIQEEADHSYRSRNDGVMHACGHDVHTTVGLGIAEQMVDRRDDLAGRVKFLFQPAEEATPEEEPVGAERMALEGALEDPDVEAIFAVHCMPQLEVGRIGYSGRNVWASSDLVEIEVRGEKSHGALPHEGVDAGLVASQIVVSLQSVVSRRIDARDSCVLSFGRIRAGESYNILPERAELTGVLRALSTELAGRAREEIRRVASETARAFGASAEVDVTPGARPVYNDLELQRRTVRALQGAFADVAAEHPSQLASEDFAAFSERVPGCYLFLGIRNESEGIVDGLHTPTFDVDERCLAVGVGAMSRALLDVAEEW